MTIETKTEEKVDLGNPHALASEWLLLHYAKHGMIHRVREVLDTNVNVDAQDEDGKTALYYAAFWDQYEMAQLLLSKKANIHICKNKNEYLINDGECTPLEAAVSQDSVQVTGLLLQHKDITEEDIQHAYRLAQTAYIMETDKENRAKIIHMIETCAKEHTIKL